MRPLQVVELASLELLAMRVTQETAESHHPPPSMSITQSSEEAFAAT